MKQQLLATLETFRNYTVGVAEAMPDKEYNFKPVDASMSFGEMLHHVAYGIQWCEKNYIKGQPMAWEPPAMKNNKKEVLSQLDLAYASLKGTISSANLTDEGIKGFFATLDHITHHRGQAVIYLRCRGAVPPEYTF